MKKRFVSVTIGSGIAIVFLLFSSAQQFILILCLVSFLGFVEFLNVFKLKENLGLYYTAIAIGILLVLTFLFPKLLNYSFSLAIAPLLLLTAALILHQISTCEFEEVAIVFVGGVYISLFLYFFTLNCMWLKIFSFLVE